MKPRRQNGRFGFRLARNGKHPATPADEHPPSPAPEPEPPAPEPGPPAPDPHPPTPEPTPPAPQLAVTRLPLDAEPREWNVWELGRVAREVDGRQPERSEELAFLLLELRQFANPDGQLPVSFDPVIRESFGELLYSAA